MESRLRFRRGRTVTISVFGTSGKKGHSLPAAEFAQLAKTDWKFQRNALHISASKPIEADLDILKLVMASTEKRATAGDAWQQLEKLVDELQELARTRVDANDFYRQLLEGCVSMLAADGGAVWQRQADGQWTIAHQVNLAVAVDLEDEEALSEHHRVLESTSKSKQVSLLQPHSGNAEQVENPTDTVILVGAVPDSVAAPTLIELFFPPGSSPETQLGWQELIDTVRHIAADYHMWDDYRHLRSERDFHTQSLALLRRVHGRSDLKRTAFEIANEGRSLVGVDRLSVLVRRGRRWQLLAVSGVDHVESRSDTTKSLRKLAKWTARWGEPIDYDPQCQLDDYPESLSELVLNHVDYSQSRRLIAVPLEPSSEKDEERPRKKRKVLSKVVLIAEQFHAEDQPNLSQRVVELAYLCQPALEQAMRLDRFGVRGIVRWSDRMSGFGWLIGIFKFMLLVSTLAGIVAALVLVERDFEIEAPARLAPLVEQDVFASTDGTIAQVIVHHGDEVEEGQLLAVLDDPMLLLELQRVRGEIETTRKRLEAIAVARIDRTVREDRKTERLSLSAEAEQLQQRLESLEKQRDILQQRREALEIRSPIAGMVLTLDVQNLLDSRPVARGQVLFTLADTTAGWQLLADVPQDSISHVVAADQREQEPLAVRFRLTGDLDEIHQGQLATIREVAVLDPEQMDEELPAIEVEISLEDEQLAAARPGMTAEVRIHCGRRPLGYIWLHDVWEAIYRWVIF